MAEFKDWNVAAASNTGSAADGYMAEGMSYANVNNAYREGQAILARWRDDNNGTVATTGAANTYAFAAPSTYTAYADGDMFMVEINATNTGASTLDVDSVGLKSIVTTNGAALTGGELVSGGRYWMNYDGTNFQVLNPTIVLTGDLSLGGTSDTVTILGTAEPTLTDANAPIVIGDSTGNHLEFGGRTLQAKGSATTTTSLRLNLLGGTVVAGDASTPAAGAVMIISGSDVPDLTDDNVPLAIGDISAQRLEFGGNDIQSKSDDTTATDLDLNPLGGVVNISNSAGSTYVPSTAGPDLVSTNPAFAVGNVAGSHTEYGGNDIQAKSDGTTATALDLNPLGGDVELGGSASSVKINGTNTIDLTDEGAPLVVGPGDAEHLELGPTGVGSGIQAKGNATTTDTLYLNNSGGAVEVGDGSTVVSVNSTAFDCSAAGYIKLEAYTVAGLPAAASGNEAGLVYVTNESGGKTLAFSDGTNWRRVQDRAVVS